MTRHSFARFDIAHLSASSLNHWIDSPGWWANKYIGGNKDDSNPAMWRGTAVETGLATLLHSRSLPLALEAAHQSYDLNATGEITAERDLIEPMLEQIAKWQPPSELLATQLRTEHWFSPIPIPIIGYLDLAFSGIDIDLKTTKALPSKPRPDHVRQVAIYRASRKRRGGVLYVTHQKFAFYEVTNEMMEEALLQLEAAALSLNNFLARMNSKEDVLRSLPLDHGHWRALKKVPLADVLSGG